MQCFLSTNWVKLANRAADIFIPLLLFSLLTYFMDYKDGIPSINSVYLSVSSFRLISFIAYIFKLLPQVLWNSRLPTKSLMSSGVEIFMSYHTSKLLILFALTSKYIQNTIISHHLYYYHRSLSDQSLS